MERLGITLTGFATLIILVMLFIIIGNITYYGIGSINWEFITQAPKEGMTQGGIFPAIFGTMALVILMTIAAIPLGVFTAIYLHEYAGQNSSKSHSILADKFGCCL